MGKEMENQHGLTGCMKIHIANQNSFQMAG
jgi:hypothetical protein